MNQVIEIVVNPRGEATVQTRGFRGSACREASRFLEQALGRSTGETLTAEFHQDQAVDQPLTQSS